VDIDMDSKGNPVKMKQELEEFRRKRWNTSLKK
jgi:hypothetical protein